LKLLALLALPVLMRFKKRVDHRQYNGAALLGLKSLVIKSHGSADAYAFEWAIKRGYDAVKMACWSAFARAMADNPVSLGDGEHDAGGAGHTGPAAGQHAEPPLRNPLKHKWPNRLSIPACSARAAICRPTASRTSNWPIVSRGRHRDERRMDRGAHGIHARHFAAPDVTTSDLAYGRARAIEAADIDRNRST
jgi:hypothetical protein